MLLIMEALKGRLLNNDYNYQLGPMEDSKSKGRFLDVSEYILKEFSPLTRALNAEYKHPDKVQSFLHEYFQYSTYKLPSIIQVNSYEKYTPEIAPIDHDASTLKITPFLNGLIEIADNQLDQFSLDPLDNVPSDSSSREKQKEYRSSRKRINSLILMNFGNDLEDIMEESDMDNRQVQESNSCPADDLIDSESSFSEEEDQKGVDFNLQRLKTQTQYKQKIDRFVKEPKNTLIREIKRIAQTGETEDKKLDEIKALLIGYVLQFELPCFEDAWEESHLPFASKVETICKGINESFKKKIGQLTFQSRRLKLLRYLEKKKLRRWRKKVSYDCRKKVADSRLRIKGKFVTREQVCSQLGISTIEQYTGDEIKQLLEKKDKEKTHNQ